MNLQVEVQQQPEKQQEIQTRAVRRSKMEMLCDTLSVIASGETAPTRVMYHANMSWIETKRCLKILIERELVQVRMEQKRESYELTEKGFELVRTFNNIRQDLNILPIR
ncbi:MAG TPA: winged helix-turn-helix domain-containing protein [Nitrososphaerales archaeon]|nr:winged helix-turn-helix domain-containing protein [Nitrososphaerales archaeon]